MTKPQRRSVAINNVDWEVFSGNTKLFGWFACWQQKGNYHYDNNFPFVWHTSSLSCVTVHHGFSLVYFCGFSVMSWHMVTMYSWVVSPQRWHYMTIPWLPTLHFLRYWAHSQPLRCCINPQMFDGMADRWAGRLVNTQRVACHHGDWRVYTPSFLGVTGVTVGWPRTKGTASNERVHSFCGFLPNPFIQALRLWRTSQEFVKTDLYPLSRGLWSLSGMPSVRPGAGR